MSRPTVPRNSLQQTLRDNTREHHAPDPFAFLEVECTILVVYDQDTMEMGAPDEVKERLAVRPGLLYAKVRLRDGREMVVPFQELEDQIFSTYGNAPLIQGRNGAVIFRNQNLESGVLTIKRGTSEGLLSHKEVSRVYDIGDIV